MTESGHFPHFDISRIETATVFREMAEKSIAHTRDSWEKMKAATEEATSFLEKSCETTRRSVADYNFKLIEISRANANAWFDFAASFASVKSLSEAVELSTGHVRQQFDAIAAQGKDLATLAQNVATEAVEPIKTGVSGAFKKVA